MQKTFGIIVLFFLLSCTQENEIRKISLTSHLLGGSLNEPDLISGELIEYIPNKKDPFHKFDPVIVQLPENKSQAFLKGYAFGFAAQKNIQISCILGVQEYSEQYHSGYLNGGRDAMGHEKWDALFGDIFDEFMEM